MVFSHVVRIPLPHYWAFLLSGYFVWNFVLQTLNTGTYIFAEHSRLTRSVAFPSEILVFSAAGSRLIEFVAEIALVLLALVLLHHGRCPSSFALLPAPGPDPAPAGRSGWRCPIATLSVFYYDVHHALPIALTTLFYLSPVFYPAEHGAPRRLRTIYFLNPIAGLLTLYHDVLYCGPDAVAPPAGRHAAPPRSSSPVGYAIFHRYAAVFAEIV